jgi:S-adenosyl-L-methionine hydrolase (adenosine-forming)
MTPALVTLTTDFGEDGPYVAAMKGVLLGINPAARLVDLSHQIPPQDLLHAAFFLRHALPYFPPGTIHVVVVDPGVGTERAALYVEVAGQRILVPDNGCWTLLEAAGRPDQVIRLTEPAYWRQPVSATFHGRDIFAPVAGHLSLGLDPVRLGEPMAEWVRLTVPQPQVSGGRLMGEVVFIDHFGNLITNLPAERLPPGSLRVRVGPHDVTRRVRTYGEAEAGSVVALVSSSGLLEIAVSQGNAARQLGAAVGTPVAVESGHGGG